LTTVVRAIIAAGQASRSSKTRVAVGQRQQEHPGIVGESLDEQFATGKKIFRGPATAVLA
jgi:hypothetical protein